MAGKTVAMKYLLIALAALEVSEAAGLFLVSDSAVVFSYEIKVCILLSIIFLLSKGLSLIARSLLLWLVVCKVVSFIVVVAQLLYGLTLHTSTPLIFAWISVSTWLYFKPKAFPGASLSDGKMLELRKVYVAAEYRNNSASDVLLSAIGWSATSISYVAGGYWYSYSRADGKFKKFEISKLPRKGRTFIEIHMNRKDAVELLDLHIGDRWSIFKNNCVTTPKEFWEKAGINLRIYEITPGLLVKKLWRIKQL